MTESNPNPLIAEIYPSRRILKLRWRFRFIAANGEKLGDDYHNRSDAEHAVRKIVETGTPVVLRTRELDGTITEHGRIR